MKSSVRQSQAFQSLLVILLLRSMRPYRIVIDETGIRTRMISGPVGIRTLKNEGSNCSIMLCERGTIRRYLKSKTTFLYYAFTDLYPTETC